MATYSVPQSGGAISISSTAGGFNQNSNPYQYYLNSGGNSQQASKYTFTFADGGSFYLTDFTQMGAGQFGSYQSSSARNVVGIPSAADTGYGCTINIIEGSNFLATYEIYDATSNTLLANNFNRKCLQTSTITLRLLPYLNIHLEHLPLELQPMDPFLIKLLSLRQVQSATQVQ